MKDVAYFLKSLRQREHITLQTLSHRTGIPANELVAFENNLMEPTPEQRRTIKRALGGSTTPDPRDPEFDLDTAIPDPRWLASDVFIPAVDFDDRSAQLANIATVLRLSLQANYPDETMDMFTLVVAQKAGWRVVVGFGFSHNPLPDESE